jgi:hypothetical protein
VMLGAHLFGLLKVSRAHLELAASVSAGRRWCLAGRQVGGSGVGWRPACSFNISWHGEAFHGLGFQGAKVSVLPGASPPPRMSPASQ